MKVILLADVKGMLFPKGLAKEATAGNLKNLEHQKAIAAEQEAERKAEAEATAKKLADLTVKIETKAGDNGKLFGSITSADIADACKEQAGIEIDKKKIVLDAPVKQAGNVEVQVKLYPEVTAKLKVEIIAK